MKQLPLRPTIRRSIAVASATTLALLVSACGGSSDAGSDGAIDDGGGQFPKTIEHAMGETELESKPKRVVALDPSFADATLLLEADLVGYTQYRDDPDKPFPEYLGDIDDATADSVNVGAMAEPDLEAILDLEPDLIISAKVRHEAIYDQLSKIASTVFSDSTGPTWKENIVLLGDALGEKEKAEELISGYQDRAAAVGEEILAKEPDLTYSLVRFAGEDTARLYSTTSFIGEIMADMAVPRPEDAPDTDEEIFVPLSAEQILKADASIIMVSAYAPPGGEGEAIEEQQRDYETNPLWERLSGEILPVDDEPFVLSVSIQGAHASITTLAEHFGVDPQLP